MKLNLTYFRTNPENTKYYSEGTIEFPHEKGTMTSYVEFIRMLMKNRTLPGLIDGHSEYHVLLIPENREPYLILWK